MAGGSNAWPLIGRTGTWPSVSSAVSRVMSRQEVLGSLSAEWWACVPTHFAVWPEESQHWSLQMLSRARSWCQNVSRAPRVGCRGPLFLLKTIWDQQVGLAQAPVRLLLLPLVLLGVWFCVHPFKSSPWRRKWQPTPVFLPGKSHGPGALQATVHGITKSQTRLNDFTTLHSKSDVSIFPSLVELLQSSPAGLQSQILWGLFFLVLDPWAVGADMGLRTLTPPVGEPLLHN